MCKNKSPCTSSSKVMPFSTQFLSNMSRRGDNLWMLQQILWGIQMDNSVFWLVLLPNFPFFFVFLLTDMFFLFHSSLPGMCFDMYDIKINTLRNLIRYSQCVVKITQRFTYHAFCITCCLLISLVKTHLPHLQFFFKVYIHQKCALLCRMNVNNQLQYRQG